jgi:hypothetical protein
MENLYHPEAWRDAFAMGAGDHGGFRPNTAIRFMISDLLGIAGGIAFLRSHISGPYLLTLHT